MLDPSAEQVQSHAVRLRRARGGPPRTLPAAPPGAPVGQISPTMPARCTSRPRAGGAAGSPPGPPPRSRAARSQDATGGQVQEQTEKAADTAKKSTKS